MSRSRGFLSAVAVGVATLVALSVWVGAEGRRWRRDRAPRLQQVVTELGLTDLALWSEARYTRHPSQSDLFSAFQDFPAAPEHFPAGSVTGPPPHLLAPNRSPEIGDLRP
jgi:hypothetical protein